MADGALPFVVPEELFAELDRLPLPTTKYIRRARAKVLISRPELAAAVLSELMAQVADGWDDGPRGRREVGRSNSARVALANLVRMHRLDWGVIFDYIQSTPELMRRWENMNKARAALLAGEIIDIADLPSETMVEVMDKKNRIEARKWIAERDDRTAFANRVVIDGSVTIDLARIMEEGKRRLNNVLLDGSVTEKVVENVEEASGAKK